MNYLTDFLQHARFPLKTQWKNIVHTNVCNYHNSKWYDRTHSDLEFETFRHLHSTTLQPANVWKTFNNRETLRSALLVSKVWTTIPHVTELTCNKCNTPCSNLNRHLICRCPSFSQLRFTTLAGMQNMLDADVRNGMLNGNENECMYNLLGSIEFMNRLQCDQNIMAYLRATFTFYI